MTVGPELKHIFLFALPIMAANLLQQLYNTADNIIVGKFAEAVAPGSFAAVGTVAPLTFLYLAFAMGLGVGASVVCSQLFGARKHEKLSQAVDTAMLLLGAIGIGVMMIGFVLSPILLRGVLSVTDEAVYNYALLYIRIYCIGLPFQFVYNAIASVLRGVGDSKASLLFLLVSSLVNVALDCWFIISFKWGVAGAAIATVISQVICVIVSYIYLRRKFPRQKDIKLFNIPLCKTIVKIGLPTAIQQSIVSFGNIAMMRLVHYFAATDTAGRAVVDAFTAGSRMDMFAFVPIIGFQSALASFAGQNLAAGREDRLKRGYYQTQAVSFACSVALCVGMYLAAEPILSLFGIGGAAMAIGVQQVRFYAKVFWIFALYMTLGGVLQGAGDTLLQSAATLSALLVRVVLAYLGVYAFGWFGYEATWETLAYGWIVALIITNARYYTGGWKKKVIARRGHDGHGHDGGHRHGEHGHDDEHSHHGHGG
jgi:putative MATE family efflux protein